MSYIGYNITMETTITFRLSACRKAELKKLAKEWDIDLSKLLREVIIDRWLDEQAKPNEVGVATRLR